MLSQKSALFENTKGRKSQAELDARKSLALKTYEEELGDKSEVELKEDFTTLTVLAFMTHNAEKYMIVAQKRSSLFWSCLMSQIFVTTMLICISYAILVNENKEYPRHQPHNFMLMVIKAPTILALHFLLSPEVENGMRIMRFANQ